MLTILIVFSAGCNKNSNVNQSSIEEQKITKSINSSDINSNKSNTVLEDIDLNKESWEKMNIFFSNFSEANVPFFEKNGLTEDELIAFGIRHNILNNPKRLVNEEKISSKYVEESVKKYFGKKISQNKTVKAYEIGTDVGYYEYDSGYYSFGEDAPYQIDPYRYPTGETSMFSQVTKVQYDIENRVYKANINIYSFYPDMYFEGKIYSEEPKEWLLKNESENIPIVCYTAIATIEKLTDGRYILIDYIQIK